ncbi:MAG: hypothetical protein IKP88_04360 [Lachnospiraceae bacterium]|nr:hypothetical protein [Lachnospiraceae bacterium]
MLIDMLNECIVDMKTVREMETASADTKKQATADYNFKQLVLGLGKIVSEVDLAVKNSNFRPSDSIISGLRSFLSSCNKVIQLGAANESTTQYISTELKKINTGLDQEWSDYYSNIAMHIIGLLDVIKSILTDDKKVIYASNKIRKAANWNTTIENYNYLKQGLEEADQILNDLGLDEDSEVLSFLKLVRDGNATILDLTDEVLKWIKTENLADKMFISLAH